MDTGIAEKIVFERFTRQLYPFCMIFGHRYRYLQPNHGTTTVEITEDLSRLQKTTAEITEDHSRNHRRKMSSELSSEIEINQISDCTLTDRTEGLGRVGLHAAVRVWTIDTFGLVASTFVHTYKVGFAISRFIPDHLSKCCSPSGSFSACIIHSCILSTLYRILARRLPEGFLERLLSKDIRIGCCT